MKLRYYTTTLVIISAFLLVFNFELQGQDLRNTEWFEIKSTRKDGSRILSHSREPAPKIKFFFENDTLFTSLDAGYSFGRKFSVNNNILSIGEGLRYNIDTITDLVLALTEIPNQQLDDDKINSFVFVNSKSIFEYLTQTQQISITGDSVIQCNSLFSPTFKGDITELLSKNFKPATIAAVLNGAIIISQEGKIEHVVVEPNAKFRKKEIEKFADIIQSTSGSWIIPPTTKPLPFKIDFSCKVSYDRRSHLSWINFAIFIKDPGVFFQKDYTVQEKSDAEKHYLKAIELNNNQQYEKAVTQFAKCIAIDSLYLDAYYGKAFSYQKLQNNNAACEIWRKLKEMGQKRGEMLYDENCNK